MNKPGITLNRVLIGLGISRYRLHKATGIHSSDLYRITHGTRKISPGVALRLGEYFKNIDPRELSIASRGFKRLNAEFWYSLQSEYILWESKVKHREKIGEIKPYRMPRKPPSAHQIAKSQ